MNLIRRGSVSEVFRDLLNDLANPVQYEKSSTNGIPLSKQEWSSPDARAANVTFISGSTANTQRASVISTSPTRVPTTAPSRSASAMETAHQSQQNFDVFDLAPTRVELFRNPEDDDDHVQHEALHDSDSSLNFQWDDCPPEHMLAFSLQDLPAILDIAIDVKPSCETAKSHSPANIIFLSARYAARFVAEDLVGELMIGAIDRIEANIHVSKTMIHCTKSSSQRQIA